MNLFIMLCSYYNVTCILSYYLQKKNPNLIVMSVDEVQVKCEPSLPIWTPQV